MTCSYDNRILTTTAPNEAEIRTISASSAARYYNSDLSIWLSVDPLSDKYPNLSPYTYCADNPVGLVDEDGRDWYENELTGDVYYARDYRKGDEHLIDGEGWKWMGENGMFGKSADDVINSNLDKVSNFSCRQDGQNGIGLAIFTGEKAESFMNNMGYEKRPLLQDVAVKYVTQTFPDATGPNAFSHTETTEKVVKTFSWTYAKNTSAIRYHIISQESVIDRVNIFTSTYTRSAIERREYNYTMSLKWKKIIDAVGIGLNVVSKML